MNDINDYRPLPLNEMQEQASRDMLIGILEMGLIGSDARKRALALVELFEQWQANEGCMDVSETLRDAIEKNFQPSQIGLERLAVKSGLVEINDTALFSIPKSYSEKLEVLRELYLSINDDITPDKFNSANMILICIDEYLESWRARIDETEDGLRKIPLEEIEEKRKPRKNN